MKHRMMQDVIRKPWQRHTAWTAADELKLEELVEQYPFLQKLPDRFGRGPSVRAPRDLMPIPERGAQRSGSK